MSKCRHQKITIIENGDWFTSHDRDDNGEWSHWQSNGDYHGRIHVECHECGLKRAYSRNHLPKWLKKAFEDALES